MGFQRPSAQKSVTNDPTFLKGDYETRNPLALLQKDIKFDKEKQKGDSARIYILSFDADVVQKIICRQAAVFDKDGNILKNKYKDKNTGRQEVMLLPFHDPGKPYSSEIEDARGVALADCTTTNIYRLPIFLHSFRRYNASKGVYETEDVMELRYLECGWSLFKSIQDLRDSQQGAGAFNPETGIPDYAIAIETVSNGASYKYEANPIMMGPDGSLDDDWKKDVYSHSLDKYLPEDFDFDTAWDELVEAMQERMSPEELKKRFAPRDSSKAGNKAIGGRPALRPAEDDEDTQAEEVDETGVEQATASPSRFSSRTKKSEEPVEEEEENAPAEEPKKTNSRFGQRGTSRFK